MFNKSSLATNRLNIAAKDMALFDATAYLFKKVPVDENSPLISIKQAMENGLVFINNGELVSPTKTQFEAASYLFGIDPRFFNQTFYKSFATTVAKEESGERLLDQFIHYFTTYGAEFLGCDIPTYVPVQKLNLPNMPEKFDWTVIQIVEIGELVYDINEYLEHLTAPNAKTIERIKAILPYATLDTEDIKSFEIQCIQFARTNTTPRNAQSYLRYAIYKSTGSTLVIKNRDCINSIKNGTPFELEYRDSLAAIFLRNKPLFLAFRQQSKHNRKIVNMLRRAAVDLHQPLKNVCLQNFAELSESDQRSVINKASNRDLVKLINFYFSRKVAAPRMYTIRNGKVFIRTDGKVEETAPMVMYLINVLRERLGDLSGKRFLLPHYIDYAVPTSEKQFIGNIPYFSTIKMPSAEFIAGVHWFNQDPDKCENEWENGRVDLDLHLRGMTQSYGWNSSYTDGGTSIVYSGDMTDAPLPNGAAEAFSIRGATEPLMFTINNFTSTQNQPFKLFFSKADGDISRNYTFNPENVLVPPVPLHFMDDKQMSIGLVNGDTFIFYGGNLEGGNVPRANYETYIMALLGKSAVMTVSSLLKSLGAEVYYDIKDIDIPEDHEEGIDPYADVISLMPADLTATTLTDIIDGNL